MTNPSPQLINIPTRRSGYCEVKPEPDLSIVRGTNPDYRDGHPQTALLVVEVAVSSGTSDREMVKASAEAGMLAGGGETEGDRMLYGTKRRSLCQVPGV